MKPAKVPGISAFVPAHNEEDNIVAVATAMLRVLPDVAECWELVIVDDGSTDRTGLLVDELARRDPRVRVVHHARNRGYGAAVRAGLNAARHDLVFFTDGDQQFDPAQLTRLLVRLDDADVVVGYRGNRADGRGRALCTWMWNVLMRATFGITVRDVNCAFKLFRRDALGSLGLRAEGAMVSAEILARVRQRGYRVVEVPVDHFPRRHGDSSGARPAVIGRALLEFVWLAGRLRRASISGSVPQRTIHAACTGQIHEQPSGGDEADQIGLIKRAPRGM